MLKASLFRSIKWVYLYLTYRIFVRIRSHIGYLTHVRHSKKKKETELKKKE